MLVATNIHHTFYENTPFSRLAVNGVELQLAPGETFVLAGPSGSGKTTLSRILTGLLKPLEGKVILNGMDLHESRGRKVQVGCKVAMACQYPERQFFAKTVWEELSWGLRVGLGMSMAEISHRLDRISADLAFQLVAVGNRPPRDLSFGQQRKAALVSLLALEPQVLILDEPFAGLNAKEKNRLIALLRQWPSRNRSMLIVTHELDLLLDWADKVAVMVEGSLVYMGSPIDLWQTADAAVRNAISLPPLVELSLYLKRSGLSNGPISEDYKLVHHQLNEALVKLRADS